MGKGVLMEYSIMYYDIVNVIHHILHARMGPELYFIFILIDSCQTDLEC